MATNHKTELEERRKQLEALARKKLQKEASVTAAEHKPKGKIIGILVVTILIVGLLVGLLLLGPKLFVGKAIQAGDFNFASLVEGQAGIPQLAQGTLAPGESLIVPIGANVLNSYDNTLYDGNVFSFQLTYNPNVFTLVNVFPAGGLTFLENRSGPSAAKPGFNEIYVAGTVNPPDGFPAIVMQPAFAWFATIEFTAVSVTATTSSEIAFDSFSVLSASGSEIVSNTVPATFTVEVAAAPPLSPCTDIDNDAYCVESAGTLPEGKLGWDDCNDTDRDVWEYRTRYQDTDQDGYPNPGAAAEQICSGGERPYGYTDLSSPVDGCPTIVNNVVTDTDGDGIWDACDVGVACTTDANCGTGLVCNGGACAETIPEVCNGFDDNSNGQIDEGTLCPTGSRCQVGRCIEVTCTDATDNDGDGQTDCADTDCGGSPGPGSTTCCNVNTGCVEGYSCTANQCVISFETTATDVDGDGISDASEPEACRGVGESNLVTTRGCYYGDDDQNGCVSTVEYTLFKAKYRQNFGSIQDSLSSSLYTIYKAKFKQNAINRCP